MKRTTSSKIRKAPNTTVSLKSKLSKPLRKAKATSVEPVFAAEIDYRDIMFEGLRRRVRSKGAEWFQLESIFVHAAFLNLW